MSAPESAPAGIARFQIQFPIQHAKSSSFSNGLVTHPHSLRIAGGWPVSVSPTLGDDFRAFDGAFAAQLAGGVSSAAEPAPPSMRMPLFDLAAMGGSQDTEERPEPATPPLCETWMPVPAAQAAERFLDFAFADMRSKSCPALYPAMPAMALATEPLTAQAPEADDFPALCEDWMPAPAAQPVERFLNFAAAKLEPTPLSLQLPSIGDLPSLRTFVRAVTEYAPSLQPQPVAIGVWAVPNNRPAAYRWPPAQLRFGLHTIDEVAPAKPVAQSPNPAGSLPGLQPMPVESMPAVRALEVAALPMASEMRMPRIACLTAQTLPQARAVAGPAAAPVETLPSAAGITVAAIAMRPTLRKPALARFQPAADAGELLATPAPPAAPEPVESMPAFAAFQAMPRPAAPAILTREFEAELRAVFPMPGVPLPAPEVVEPRVAMSRPALLDPMARIAAHPAGAQPERPKPEIPHPGIISLEFFSQRIASSPLKRVEPMDTTIAVQPPPFAIQPVSGLPAQKHGLVLPFAEIFGKSASSKRRNITLTGKIAATIMVGLALWGGSRVANLSQHTEQLRAEVAASERSVTAAEAHDPNRFGKGTMGKLRRAIAERAATEITDTFHSGMAAWGAEPKTFAAGWKRHPQGYVSVGDMALFQPSIAYTDYRMEFYGQIENKSMNWVVRAQDKKNYYAMRFKVIESGLRPIIAMVHYGVVNGKAGHKVETPLSVMVHNNQPLHVAVDVRGNHFTASIEGEPIESWTDDALPKGGVGFFADAGEKARLYWMRLSRNQDWLGRVCAYMSGDGRSRQQTAEVWGPGMPHQRPEPANPREADPALAAVAALGGMNSPGRAKTGKQRRNGWIS